MIGVVWSLVLDDASAAELRVCGEAPTEPCFADVQSAVDAAEDGDTILLGEGFFEEAVVLDHRTLTIAPDGDVTPAFVGDGSAEPLVRIIGGEVTLEGLLLGNATGRALEISDGAEVRLSSMVLSGSALLPEGGLMTIVDSGLVATGTKFSGGSAVRSGGQIWSDTSDLSFEGCRFVGGWAARAGGVLISTNDAPVQLSFVDSTFLDNRSDGSAGAALFLEGRSDAHADMTITVRGCLFDGNSSFAAGVIHAHYSTGTTEVSETVFRANQSADSNPGLVIHDAIGVVVARNRFCHNAAEATPERSGALVVERVDSLDAHNNVFVENHLSAVTLTSDVAYASVRNNHFIGNVAAFRPVVDAALGVGLEFSDNLLAYNVGTSPQTHPLGVEADAVVDHNLWWQNSPHDPFEDGPDEVIDDPELEDYVVGEACEYIDASKPNQRDGMWPSWYGAARDAGSDRARDLDGSPLDIGAFGGPDARDFPDWEDGDQDGVPTLFDCDRFLNTSGSGLPDAPYDGIDQDCRRNDDYDADGDGFRPEAWATSQGPPDCDDDDKRRFPGQDEIASNGIDDDCDGWADNTGVLRVGRCDAGAVGGWAWVAVVVVARRRRLGA